MHQTLDLYNEFIAQNTSGIMISNVVVSLFGAAYNWPLGAAISASLLLLVLALLFLVESIEKKLSFS